jgi:hypothetical protein
MVSTVALALSFLGLFRTRAGSLLRWAMTDWCAAGRTSWPPLLEQLWRWLCSRSPRRLCPLDDPCTSNFSLNFSSREITWEAMRWDSPLGSRADCQSVH